MLTRSAILGALAVLVHIPADARPAPVRTPAAPCTTRAPLPTGFAGFARATGPTRYLAVGAARRVALRAAAGVRFAVAPERTPGPNAIAAVLPIDIARAGTYRVALSEPVWIDMVAGGRRIASGAHEEGPRCSGIRKIVDFQLRPGRHVIQLSGPRDRLASADAVVMVVRR